MHKFIERSVQFTIIIKKKKKKKKKKESFANNKDTKQMVKKSWGEIYKRA